MRITMVPTGWHKRSQNDWLSTAGTPVKFSQYGQLTPDQLGWLQCVFPSGEACFWATSKPGDRPRGGDQVWFHQGGNVIAIADVRASFDNAALAGALWPEDIEYWQKGLPETPEGWRYVFAFTEPLATGIPKRAIGPLLGYSANYQWQGAHRLDEHQTELLQARLVYRPELLAA